VAKPPRRKTPGSPAGATQAARPRRPAHAADRHQADAFRASRRSNAAETAEDYAELIDDLIRHQGEARSVDLAARLGVTHVTVAKTIQRLGREGLVRAEPYRAVFLTPKGQALAERCRRRHVEVVAFLVALGVSPATAEVDAEGIEHHVSDETLGAMRRFIKKGPRRSARALKKTV
jgi:DtxR family manganese transport transcriptional regulator